MCVWGIILCVNSELLWGEEISTYEMQRTRELLAIESAKKDCISDCELAILDWEDENELFKLDWDNEVVQEDWIDKKSILDL